MDPARLVQILDAFEPCAVNFGTGESCMNPGFPEAFEAVVSRGIPLSITTNGRSIGVLSDREVAKLHDVDVSIDFPSKADHDGWRGSGSFDMAMEAVDRCRSLGVTCSLVMCLMDINASRSGEMCALCAGKGVDLRVNVYKPVNSRRFSPGYGSFWGAIAELGREARLASCSEPIVNAALAANGHPPGGSGSPCGTRGIRISSVGEVHHCVYVTVPGLDAGMVISEPGLLEQAGAASGIGVIPADCTDCIHLDVCRGGCFGRRHYSGLHLRDEFCFIGREVPALPAPCFTEAGRWVHSGYLCTLIYTGR
jgi:radical SAM protein with 4Fe4S-binding SPASM domain